MAKNKPAKKIKKQKKEPRKIAPIKLPIKGILRLVIVFILILSFYMLLRNLSYFNLDEIRIIDRHNISEIDRESLLDLYEGRNIFDINIDSVSSRIKNDFPVIEKVIVRRVLPNRLEINIVPRIAVAMIKSRGHFPVDRTGMVLPSKMKSRDLPVITGLSFWRAPRPGERLENRQIESAFSLIDTLKKSPTKMGYNVTRINASNYRNLSFYLQNGIEVKIGHEKFFERLKVLRKTLARRDLDKDNIKYIDLRFRDVVIGPK